jgi:hypothetical protein
MVCRPLLSYNGTVLTQFAVRNRSRELVELLSDVEKIRAERRKSKANKHRYTGTGNDALSFSSSDSRYGGFGGDTFNGGSYDRGMLHLYKMAQSSSLALRIWRIFGRG